MAVKAVKQVKRPDEPLVETGKAKESLNLLNSGGLRPDEGRRSYAVVYLKVVSRNDLSQEGNISQVTHISHVVQGPV